MHCLHHELLIAKRNVYGFSLPVYQLVHDYLPNRKQKNKVKRTYISWLEIVFDLPQGSILGPLSYNINIFLADLLKECYNCFVLSLVKRKSKWTYNLLQFSISYWEKFFKLIKFTTQSYLFNAFEYIFIFKHISCLLSSSRTCNPDVNKDFWKQKDAQQ